MYDMTGYLKKIDEVTREGTVYGQLGIAVGVPGTGVVSGCEVRHFHPLGRLQRASV